MRIVSLTCSNTEIVCALGYAGSLVGVDDHSDHPEEVVARLPRVGPDLQIDVEKVIGLKPDLVLASLTVPGHEAVVDRVEKAGLPFIAPAPESLSHVYRDITDIASLLGVPERGESLVAEMRAGLGESLPGPAGPSILIQWWPKPVISPGRRSWAHDLIEAAGGRNPLGNEPVKSRPLHDDEVRELAPDAIVISWCGVHPSKYRPDVVYRNERWRDLPALARGRVFTVPEAYLGRPGPRLLEGWKALRAIVEQSAG
jgi:iron complex transport system substrate-binding protein